MIAESLRIASPQLYTAAPELLLNRAIWATRIRVPRADHDWHPFPFPSPPIHHHAERDKNMSAESTTFNVSDTPLPPSPQHDPLNPQQWSILFAIADAVVPALTRTDDGDHRLLQHPLRVHVYDAAVKRIRDLARHESDETALAYLSESASNHPMFKESIARLVVFYMREEARNGLLFILTALK